MAGFDNEKIREAISEVCSLFDSLSLSMTERWYVCLCIERSAEGIMAEGFKEASEQLHKVKEKFLETPPQNISETSVR